MCIHICNNNKILIWRTGVRRRRTIKFQFGEPVHFITCIYLQEYGKQKQLKGITEAHTSIGTVCSHKDENLEHIAQPADSLAG